MGGEQGDTSLTELVLAALDVLELAVVRDVTHVCVCLRQGVVRGCAVRVLFCGWGRGA